MRREDTLKGLGGKDGVPLMSIIELEAALQSGGLLKRQEDDAAKSDKKGREK